MFTEALVIASLSPVDLLSVARKKDIQREDAHIRHAQCTSESSENHIHPMAREKVIYIVRSMDTHQQINTIKK